MRTGRRHRDSAGIGSRKVQRAKRKRSEIERIGMSKAKTVAQLVGYPSPHLWKRVGVARGYRHKNDGILVGDGGGGTHAADGLGKAAPLTRTDREDDHKPVGLAELY